jgi:GNAT superfamily N-acetyltransferase
MRDWLENGRYQAAIARRGDDVLAYVLWRDDHDYGDIYVRQFFVSREHRGAGLGRALFERAVRQFWPGRPLRLGVYDSHPRGRAFWERPASLRTAGSCGEAPELRDELWPTHRIQLVPLRAVI